MAIQLTPLQKFLCGHKGFCEARAVLDRKIARQQDTQKDWDDYYAVKERAAEEFVAQNA